MKILLLAGEESGKIYANHLRKGLNAHEIRGYEDYGFKTADLAVMGFVAVLKRLPYFLKVKRVMQDAIVDWKPDVIVTIDYPGLNLKLAAFAKARGIRSVHIVCPQVWAWKAGRIPKIEASLDHLCCFFPFEPSLFTPGFATFVGHPLVETFEESRKVEKVEDKTIAILPGSRLSEINRNFPIMIKAFSRLDIPNLKAIVPAANQMAYKRIKSILKEYNVSGIMLQSGGAREVLLKATCAMVASGTATLEAALAQCPTVLVYRVSALLAWFARRVIKGVHHLGLINIVWDKMKLQGECPMIELIQENFTPENVAKVLSDWLKNPSLRDEAVLRLKNAVKILKTDDSALEKIINKITNG